MEKLNSWEATAKKSKPPTFFLAQVKMAFVDCLFSFLLIYVPFYFTKDLRELSENTQKDKELKK